MQKNIHKLLAATLLIGGSLSGVQTALAQSTPAGTTISNTANATYSDGTTTYNATSNTVTVKVSEVPGINVAAQPPSKPSPAAGDTLYVDFVVTNVGNNATQFFIPSTATLSDPTDFSINGALQIVAVNGSAITPVPVPTAPGDTTGNLLGATQGLIPVGGTVTVRVPIKVGAVGAGISTTVALGDTATPNAQNVDRSTNQGAKDVYTIPNAGVTIQNEAMATSSAITVGSRPQAFAAVLKAVSSYSDGGTPNVLTDDVLTYKLALKIDNPASPPTGLTVSDLYGTQISVDNSTVKPYVVVSDAIPTGLQLGLASGIVAPSGWTTVYTQDATSITALNAKWTTARPSTNTSITRIGFIYDTTTAPLAKGTTVSGFQIAMTPTATFTGGQLANIAQSFGQSQSGAVVPGTSTQIVYDESGDQTDNDGLGGTNPDPTTAGGASTNNGGISDGVANPVADGIDPGKGTDPTQSNTNQGADTGVNAGTKPQGGEDTIYTIATTPLNGPNGQPGAINTTNNDDFTNKSIVVAAGKDPTVNLTDTETSPVTFTNTIQNTSGSPQTISLLPTPPATPADLPDGTKVTITDPVSSKSATYTYDVATGFTFSSGTTGLSATQPVSILVPAGATNTAQYQVVVDLPAAAQLKGFPVPITAFVDTKGTGLPATQPSNITIDRVYTGYVSLLKDARILEADGTTQVVAFTAVQATLSAAAKPGRIIEYRIQYSNLSTAAPASSNSVDLSANSLVITENGSAAPNNWFPATKDPAGATNPGSAVDPTGVITTTASGGDIQIYIDTIAKLNPQVSGTFTFRRQIK